MAKRSVALILSVLTLLLVPGNATPQRRSSIQAVFADLLRLYGCVRIVRLIAIDALSSSHGGIVFSREMTRVQDGTDAIDVINQEGLRCGRVKFPASTSPLSRCAFEELEAVAHTLARASIYERLPPEKAQPDIAAALSRFRTSELPEVSDFASSADLTAALGPQAGQLLREHEAWVGQVMSVR